MKTQSKKTLTAILLLIGLVYSGRLIKNNCKIIQTECTKEMANNEPAKFFNLFY